jgi:signal transduction histidine kinase
MGAASTTEQREQMLQVIQEESGRLESFVSEFLEVAIPRDLHRSAVDLEKLCRDAMRAHVVAGKSCSIVWNVEPDLPTVSADAELLRRAFDNLARNALESKDGADGEKVTLTVTLRCAGGENIEWCIEDDGPGIAEGRIDRMTEPYFTTKASGTGLGLAMVRRVVEQHGGRLAIANRPSGGARFTITLPIGPP